jgi:hypothetical protein
MTREAEQYWLKTQVHVRTEITCSDCFVEMATNYGGGEDNYNAAAAFAEKLYAAGWRVMGTQVLCPGCVKVKESKGDE